MRSGSWGGRWRVLAGALALLLVPAVAAAQPNELQADLAEIGEEQQRTQRELATARAREGDAQATLAEVSARLDEAESQLAALVEELARAEAARDLALEALDTARVELALVEAARDRAEAELHAKREQLDARVRAAFKYGQVSFVEAFVGTKDIVEFLNSSTYLSSVLEGDRTLVAEVGALLAEVEAQRGRAEVLRAAAEREAESAAAASAEVERATREQQRMTAVIAERRAEHERTLATLSEDRAAIEEQLAALEAEGRRIGEQLALIARQQAEEQRRAAEAARQAEERAREAAATQPGTGAPPPAGAEPPSPAVGGWVRPVPGRVTSVFGPRWGRNHNGVDLAGPVGSPVVAARAGTVVHVTGSCHPTNSFGCGGGYGNYVTLVHDGGMATIYAHLAAVSVGTGQHLEAGQVLGTVGNSGSSYGPHLHFEIREAGQPRNPCGYISC